MSNRIVLTNCIVAFFDVPFSISPPLSTLLLPLFVYLFISLVLCQIHSSLDMLAEFMTIILYRDYPALNREIRVNWSRDEFSTQTDLYYIIKSTTTDKIIFYVLSKSKNSSFIFHYYVSILSEIIGWSNGSERYSIKYWQMRFLLRMLFSDSIFSIFFKSIP